MFPEEEIPPVPGLVKCPDGPCQCNVCPRHTIWRARTFDIHVCSKECYEELREVIECDEHPLKINVPT